MTILSNNKKRNYKQNNGSIFLQKNELLHFLNSDKKIAIIECFIVSTGFIYIMEPVMAKIKKKFNVKVSLFRIKIDANSNLISKYQITSDPTYLFFKKGKLIDKNDGIISLTMLNNKLEKIINSKKSEKYEKFQQNDS